MAATRSILHRINVVAARGATFMVALACALAAIAPPARGADEDLPARVGRIADFGGAVYIAPEDRANEWAEVGLNYPVASGDNLWISGDGRAEVDLGGSRLRLAGDTNVHLSRLDDRELSLFVAQGRVILRLRALDPGEVARVDTPNTQVTLLRPGLYRVDVSTDRQETTLVVREGEATASVTNGLQQVLPGQTATLFGDQDVQADVRNGTGLDGFDTWSADRDRYYRGNRTAEYVSPQMVGAADLDQYGTWQTYPDYGAVWFPTSVAVGWAPYRYGRWVSLSGWGLTWVDDAPWGYAPFHYGRWAYVGGRWGWCPGRYVARPVWAPALVAWYGGGGVAVGGYGPVYGWVPLGWRDPYIPSWRNCSNRCWNDYNRPYAVNVAERPRQPPTHYANYQVPGAVTAMSGAAFVSGKPVAVNRVNLPSGQLSGLPPLSGAPQVKPLPIATTSVRPGNGAPIPASNAFGTQKPMAVSPQRPATSAPGVPAQPWSKPAPAYNAAESPRPTYAQPPRAAPAQNAAERPPRTGPTSAPGAPMPGSKPQPVYAAPPGQAYAPPTSANSAPPGRMRTQEGAANRAESPSAPQQMAPRAFAPPPQPAMSAPPGQMRAAPPPPQPAMSAPPGQTRAAPPPPQPAVSAPPGQMRAAPAQGQAVQPPPPAQPPAPRAVEKPAVAKPAPVPNQN